MRSIQLDLREVTCIQLQTQPDYVSILYAFQKCVHLSKFQIQIKNLGGFRISLLEQWSLEQRSNCYQQIAVYSDAFFRQPSDSTAVYHRHFNIVPRVLRVFGQRLITWSRTLENLKNKINLLIGCFVTTSIVLPAVIKFQFPRVYPGDQALAKGPEDCRHFENLLTANCALTY